MRKAMLAGVLAVMLLPSAALAEIYEGTVTAATSVQVEAASGGVLEALNVSAGVTVAEGDALGSIRTTRVFASQDGTVASISAREGEEADGTVLELAPVERYQIYCTVDKAYQSAGATLVHAGEQVYIKCTANGTHRGVGLISRIDGSEFRMLTVGGELYVGETVYLYRDDAFSTAQRVGIGTVVAADTEVYEADGRIVRMHVAEGEYVERGELLYEVAADGEGTITAPVSGIVTETAVKQGDRVEEGQAILTLAPLDGLCIEIAADEAAAAQLSEGDAVTIVYTADPQEREAAGAVAGISRIADGEAYSVKILPESSEGLRLGMTATVRTQGD